MQFNLNNRRLHSANVYRRAFNFKNFPIWAFILVGIAIISAGFLIVYDEDKTSQWPTVEGTVVDIDTTQKTNSQGNLETTHTYTIAYTVKGKEYTEAKRADNYIGMGAKIDLIYNPDNPADNRLSNSGGWLGWFVVAGGILIAIVSALLTFNKRLKTAISEQPAGEATQQIATQPQQLEQTSLQVTTVNTPPSDGRPPHNNSNL
jgi:hypothetical protein